MSDTIPVKTSGQSVIGDKQALYFAISILPDVKTYIKEHHAEFEVWKTEQEGETDAA